MGDQLATPGKANSTSDAAYGQGHAHAPAVGKTSQVDQHYAAQQFAAGVSASHGAGDFLTEHQSNDLDRQITFRLGILAKNYSLALMTLKVEQMIKKPEELSLFLTLCLGVLESVLTAYGALAVKALRKKGAAMAAVSQLGAVEKGAEQAAEKGAEKAAASEVAKAGKDAEKAMVNLTEVQLNSIIKTGVAKGKTKAAPALAGTSADASKTENDKAQATSYLTLLMNEGDLAADRLDQSIGSASEATRLAAWAALEPSQHTEAMYETKLRAQLQKYMADPTSRIGRSEDWKTNGLGPPTHVEKEVRIVRVIEFMGVVRYAEQDAVFDAYLHDHPEKAQRSPAYDAEQGALSLEQDATWNIGGKEQQHHETPMTQEPILNYVDREFEQLAVKKQEHVWQKPIETYQLKFTRNGPRLVKVAGA